LILATCQRQKEFRRPAAAVKDRRLGITSLEAGIIATQPAVVAKGLSAQNAMIEMERMASRKDRLVIPQVIPTLVRPEQPEGHPSLPNHQGE
jgi:hypothetical protein